MRPIRIRADFLAVIFAVCLPAAAQLSPSSPDPLSQIREAAKSNVEACSATGETLCEQVAPKIIANASDSRLDENLRRLSEGAGAQASGTWTERVAAWGVVAFREAGLEARTESYANRNDGAPDEEDIVAEFRGREKPQEWVVVGAHLGARQQGEESCDAAAVIEAARDIARAGIHPRRSIRFVLFIGGSPGSSAYVRAHRSELDLARAALIVAAGCGRMSEYSLNGRHEIEPGVREAAKPAESLGNLRYDFDVRLRDSDFLVEGIPTISADRERRSASTSAPDSPDKVSVGDLKLDSATVGVTAFGIAEQAEPVGQRQSRAEIESLLEASGLGEQMKAARLWTLWESGQLGRQP